MEAEAGRRMLAMLPEDMQQEYASLLQPQPEDEMLWKLCKAADKLTALLKCIEEEKLGNTEFVSARQATETALDEMDMPEIVVFKEEYLPAFGLTLDELNPPVKK